MIALLLTALAFADVVDDPPTDCPDGSRGQTSHAGTWCEPDTCGDSNSTCEEGETCAPLGLCIETFEYTVDSGNPQPWVERHVVGLCDAQGQCAQGTCEQLEVCAEPSRAACGCASGEPVVGSLGGLGLLALLRRRTRPRGGRNPR